MGSCQQIVMDTIKYLHSEGIHNLKAPQEIVPVIKKLINPSSVLDVGCGTGTWLKVFEQNGISDLQGIDGIVLPEGKTHISPNRILHLDLSQPFDLKRRFDLAVCLEVAEHLPETSADGLVASIVKHADHVLFSAAIPGQGGQYHLNEQWPEYWQQKFEKHGFYFHDPIRPIIWKNEKIDSWYRQNIFIIDKNKGQTVDMLSIVHPAVFRAILRNHDEMLKSMLDGKQGIRMSSRIFIQSLIYKVRSLFGSSL